MIDPRLEGRVVIITGANNPYGVGAALAKSFAAEGAHVFLHYFRAPARQKAEGETTSPGAPGMAFYQEQQAKNPDDVLRAVAAYGAPGQAWGADLSIPENVPKLFDLAELAFGPVEILINNAGHWQPDTFLPGEEPPVNPLAEHWLGKPEPLAARSFNRLFSVNTRAAALMMAEFAKRHVRRAARWGRIINISADGAWCRPGEASFAASKMALDGYTRSAAVELGQHGITVNAVSLGPVQTGWISLDLEKELLPGIPLGHLGTPEEVAPLILFIASDQARWMTGQIIRVDGGRTV